MSQRATSTFVLMVILAVGPLIKGDVVLVIIPATVTALTVVVSLLAEKVTGRNLYRLWDQVAVVGYRMGISVTALGLISFMVLDFLDKQIPFLGRAYTMVAVSVAQTIFAVGFAADVAIRFTPEIREKERVRKELERAQRRAKRQEEADERLRYAADVAERRRQQEEAREKARLAAMDEEARLRRLRDIPAAVKRAVWERDGGQCVNCGATGVGASLQFDHIVPFSLGGGNQVENIQLLCQKCNLQKSNMIGV